MGIKLRDSNAESEVTLDIIEYLDDGNSKYFKISNREGKEIVIQYVPTSDSNWELSRYEVILFENPYLKAENDVFEIRHSNLKGERLGWIFPITILESNDNDFINHKNLNNYKFIAYKYLLNKGGSKILQQTPDNIYKLTDLYFDSTILCVLCKNTISKINNFSISDYILSFHRYGYSLFFDWPKARAIFDKSDFIKTIRNTRSSIKLSKPSIDIKENTFIKYLFEEHLIQIDNCVLRFIFLYQILEYLMEKEFDLLIKNQIEDFNKKRISKNDLRENLISDSRERDLIKSVIEKSQIDNSLKLEFEQECSFLFSNINFTSKKNSFGDQLYNFRNIITHRLRDVTTKPNDESVTKISEIFERIIIDILMNYSYSEIPPLVQA